MGFSPFIARMRFFTAQVACRTTLFGFISSMNWLRFPFPRAFGKCFRIFRPVVQRGRIKIRAVRPDQRVNFRVNPHLIENGKVLQRAIQFTRQYRTKINQLFRGVIKTYAQHIGRDNFD